MRTTAFVLLCVLSGYTQPRASNRPPDSHTIRGAASGLLGWRLAVPSSAFKGSTFAEAVGKVDALGVGFIEGSAPQLDYNLSADELSKVKARLGELRMRMLSYRAGSIPAGANARKIFAFAKNLNVETIEGSTDAASLPE